MPSNSMPPSAGQRSLKNLAKKQQEQKPSKGYFDQRLEGDHVNAEKIVNVSIDDLHDSEGVSSNDNWMRVPAHEVSKKDWQHGVINQFNQKREPGEVRSQEPPKTQERQKLDKYK